MKCDQKVGLGTGAASLTPGADASREQPGQQHASWRLGAQGPDPLGGSSWDGVKGPSPARPSVQDGLEVCGQGRVSCCLQGGQCRPRELLAQLRLGCVETTNVSLPPGRNRERASRQPHGPAEAPGGTAVCWAPTVCRLGTYCVQARLQVLGTSARGMCPCGQGAGCGRQGTAGTAQGQARGAWKGTRVAGLEETEGTWSWAEVK